MTSTLPPGNRLPPRRLPWLYLMSGQLALALAFVTTAIRPGAFAQFFYHPQALAIVHLVTIGWITGSILGSLYVLAPVAWRAPVPAGRADAIAFALWIVGLVGMVAHFWIGSYGGMIWSAGAVLAAALLVAGRVGSAVLRAPVGVAHKLHLAVAFANLLAAGALGIWIGLEKLGVARVPGSPLAAVYAHAHLAAIGWATLTVIGAAQRLLPMFLPAAMPPPGLAIGSLVLVELGLAALVVGLLSPGPGAILGAWSIAAGIVLFLVQVGWMLRHRRRPPAAMRRPDLALGHTLLALLWLAVATALGLWLAHARPSEATIRLAATYGVIGLVGFLSQLVVGVGSRLLPLTAWMQSFVDSGHQAPERSPHRLLDRRLQAAIFVAWAGGVPLLGAGVRWSHEGAISAACALLGVGVVLEGCNRVRVLRLARPAGHTVA